MYALKQDLAISLMIHAALFALIVLLSVSVTRVAKPKLNLGPTVSVRMTEEIPRGKPSQPSIKMPAIAKAEDSFTPEPVKLKSITEKAKIEIKKPPVEKKTETKADKPPEKKPEDQPKVDKPPENKDPNAQYAKVDQNAAKDTAQNAPSGSSMEMDVGGSESGEEGVYSGPLGEYYLAYDFGYVRSRIRQNWTNPIKSNSEIGCKVYFQITKNGTIQGVVVSESSGQPLFDKYAELAVKETRKLPSLPQSFPENEVLEVYLKFVYRP